MAYIKLHPVKQLDFQINRIMTYGDVACDFGEVKKAAGEITDLDSWYRVWKQLGMTAENDERSFRAAYYFRIAEFFLHDSTEKQEIFSRIFDVTPYARLTARIAGEEGEIRAKLEDEQWDIARAVRELVRLGYGALEDEYAQYRSYEELAAPVLEALEWDKARLNQTVEQITSLEKEKSGLDLPGAKAFNHKLARMHELEATSRELESLALVMAKKQELLQKLLAARELGEQEKIVRDTGQLIEKYTQRIAQLEAQSESTLVALNHAQANYTLCERLSEDGAQAKLEAQHLEQQAQTAAVLNDRRKNLEDIKGQIAETKQKIAVYKLLEREREREERINALSEFINTARALEDIELAAAASREEAHAVEKEYENAFRAFKEGQAALLAAELKPGENCPVCGSDEHPAPAKTNGELQPNGALQAAKQKKEEAQKALQEILLRRESLTEQYRIRSGGLGLEEGGLSAAESERKTLTEEQSFQAETHLELTSLVADLPEKISELDSVLATLKEEAAAHSAILQSEQNQEPLSAEKLLEKAAALHRESEEKVKLSKVYAEAYHDKKSRMDKLTAQTQAAREHTQSVSEQYQRQRAALKARLEESGFEDYEVFATLRVDCEKAPDIKNELDQYAKNRTQISYWLEALQAETAGREPADIQALEKRDEQLALDITALRNVYGELTYNTNATLRCLEEIRALHRRTAELGKRYGILRELSDLARGIKTPYISFERYILIACFEDIIQLANIYLMEMTGSRYRLLRKEDGASRTAGLDIDVLDNYTGTRRDVSTLSGGEGFKASLSLAMGLSDLVQIYAGGIKLGAIFIDEGFGSLDEKSLDSAMSTLLSLEKRGRMVGIISHIRELESYIPARLQVAASPTGSSVKFILP